MSKYVDIPSTMHILGNIYNNLSLVQDERYPLQLADFADNFHKSIYSIFYELYGLGNQTISEIEIADYISTRPKLEGIFNQNNGFEYLKEISKSAQHSSYDYYYQRLKKMSLLRAYDNLGVDVTYLYDPDNVTDTIKKEAQENWLDKTKIEEIANIVEDKLLEIHSRFVDNSVNEAVNAGLGLENLVGDLMESPNYGYPLYGAYINTVHRGARLGCFYLRSSSSGVGKAIPNYTLIPTTKGLKRVDEINIGDELFGLDGKPTKVKMRFPQQEQKDIYKLYLADGRVAECCNEHLWEIWTVSKSRRTMSLNELLEVTNNGTDLQNSDKGYKYFIQRPEAVQFTTKTFSVHPYVMGAILGDGSLRYNHTNRALSFSSENDEIPKLICKYLDNKYIPHKNSEHNYNWTFKPLDDTKHNLWVEEILIKYPELWNKKSEDKFIPREYLYGDIEQRYALLQGLMDTDGSVDNRGRIRFATISEQLKNDFIELCYSLGFSTHVIEDIRDSKYTTGKCYNINIITKPEDKIKVFQLKRKHDRILAWFNNGNRKENKKYIAITKIEKTDIKTDMTCFTVDNDDHMFLMNDYIPTHNSRSLVADACYVAMEKFFDEKEQKWIYTNEPAETLLITTEQDIDEVQTMILSFISGVPEERILNGNYESDNEYDRVLESIEVINNGKLKLIKLGDFSINDIENTIKRSIRKYNTQYVFLDYIHTSLKILDELSSRSNGMKMREDLVLFMISDKLKQIAVNNNVFIESSTQLNGDYKQGVLDQNALRGAKAIADKIDFGCIMVETNDKDIEALAPILAQRPDIPEPKIKISVYKNRRGKWKNIILWCEDRRDNCRINPLFITKQNYELIDDFVNTHILISSQGEITTDAKVKAIQQKAF